MDFTLNKMHKTAPMLTFLFIACVFQWTTADPSVTSDLEDIQRILSNASEFSTQQEPERPSELPSLGQYIDTIHNITSDIKDRSEKNKTDNSVMENLQTAAGKLERLSQDTKKLSPKETTSLTGRLWRFFARLFPWSEYSKSERLAEECIEALRKKDARKAAELAEQITVEEKLRDVVPRTYDNSTETFQLLITFVKAMKQVRKRFPVVQEMYNQMGGNRTKGEKDAIKIYDLSSTFDGMDLDGHTDITHFSNEVFLDALGSAATSFEAAMTSNTSDLVAAAATSSHLYNHSNSGSMFRNALGLAMDSAFGVKEDEQVDIASILRFASHPPQDFLPSLFTHHAAIGGTRVTSSNVPGGSLFELGKSLITLLSKFVHLTFESDGKRREGEERVDETAKSIPRVLRVVLLESLFCLKNTELNKYLVIDDSMNLRMKAKGDVMWSVSGGNFKYFFTSGRQYMMSTSSGERAGEVYVMDERTTSVERWQGWDVYLARTGVIHIRLADTNWHLVGNETVAEDGEGSVYMQKLDGKGNLPRGSWSAEPNC